MVADSDQLPAILLTQPAPVPAIIAARGAQALHCFAEFFTANIRKPNTRKAYYRATTAFFGGCEQARLNLLDIKAMARRTKARALPNFAAARTAKLHWMKSKRSESDQSRSGRNQRF